jgi:hypothetical protein
MDPFAHSSGISLRTTILARVSSLRLVSWVVEARRALGFVEFFQEKNIPQKVEDRGVDGRIAPFGRAHGAQNDLPIRF